MRSSRRDAPAGFFRGSEMARMMGMILLLGVLVMMMGQAADPRMWRWLVDEADPTRAEFGTAGSALSKRDIIQPGETSRSRQTGDDTITISPVATTQDSAKPDPETKPADPKPADPKPAAEEKPVDRPNLPIPQPEETPDKKADKPEGAALEKPMDDGATEADEEQWAGFQEEIQAISDKSFRILKEEMPAYWRLLLWADSQTYDQMAKKARADVLMNNFTTFPDEMRGKLVRLKLNVRRAIAYDAPDNPVFAKKIYEIWGFTEDSPALYVGLTSDLPDDFPLGPKIAENATFVGYFFKLQGYYPAAHKEGQKGALQAPLLVGKLDWTKAPSQSGREVIDGSWWIWIVVGTIIVLGAVRVVAPTLFSAGVTAPARPPDKEVKLGDRWDGEDEAADWETNPDDWKRGTKDEEK